jgi:hypothetical protein
MRSFIDREQLNKQFSSIATQSEVHELPEISLIGRDLISALPRFGRSRVDFIDPAFKPLVLRHLGPQSINSNFDATQRDGQQKAGFKFNFLRSRL